ncbi:MAG TPA: glycine cleavage system protein H [Methylophaga aminisulfidivorans]|uniref:Glycine cleavage system protein H n=2 Tax=root TaxID=1 RepID=A0A7C1VRZ5_9GAMM|nr:glycine cleavage system protein H [Methylophaga aminisulfidivorans]HEC75222.1 glycine cleavage system protein H [Methylophaga aminisulfidivorans]
MVFSPELLSYTRSHLWLALDKDIARIGITEFMQDQLSQIDFLTLPLPGKHYEAGEPIITLESRKSAIEIRMPYSASVVSINEQLQERPQLINQDPFGDGWLCCLDSFSASLINHLIMSYEAYEAMLDG